MKEKLRVYVARVPRWQIILVAAVAVAIALALFLLTIGIFLLILPVLLFAGAFYYLFGSRRAARDSRADSGGFIETEYREIEPGRDRDNSKGS
jgi:hypothetical protein